MNTMCTTHFTCVQCSVVSVAMNTMCTKILHVCFGTLGWVAMYALCNVHNSIAHKSNIVKVKHAKVEHSCDRGKMVYTSYGIKW